MGEIRHLGAATEKGLRNPRAGAHTIDGVEQYRMT